MLLGCFGGACCNCVSLGGGWHVWIGGLFCLAGDSVWLDMFA